MDAEQKALLRKFAEIAANGVFRDAEFLAQLAGDQFAVFGEALEKLLFSVSREHGYLHDNT